MDARSHSASTLWSLAEFAAAYQGRSLALFKICSDGEERLVLMPEGWEHGEGTQLLFKVGYSAEKDADKMSRPFAITCEYQEQSLLRIPLEDPTDENFGDPKAHPFDALFWHPAAVEKFLFPYYSRSPTTLHWLEDAIKNPEVTIVGHRKPTVLTSDGDESAGVPDPHRTLGIGLKGRNALISLSEYIMLRSRGSKAGTAAPKSPRKNHSKRKKR